MRVLVVGPGVIGSVVAFRLARAGHDLTVLGRGARLAQVKRYGLRLYDTARGVSEQTRVATASSPDGAFDWILVAVGSHQVAALFEPLARCDGAAVLTLVNQAAGLEPWRAAWGERLVPGFPGISGAMVDGVVSYQIAPRWMQPTTFGEVDGTVSPRGEALRAALEAGGIPTRFEPAMDAWLRWHAAWIGAIMMASLACRGQPERLVRDPALRGDTIQAMRETFAALHALEVPVRPPSLVVLERMPPALLSQALAFAATRPELAGRIRDGAIRGEAEHVLAQLQQLHRDAKVEAPAFARLHAEALGPDESGAPSA